ncbi:MAG: hypothetical protein K8F27_03620 [Sulfuricellaceae bacterium]|nr:hypothetical protein [Sulfuricellaceae bacterium]
MSTTSLFSGGSRTWDTPQGYPRRLSDFRAGDVRHSLADIGKAQRLLGYAPSHTIVSGMNEAADWYIRRFKPELLTK